MGSRPHLMQKNQRNAFVAVVIAAALIGAFIWKKGAVPENKGPLVKDDLSITRVFARGKETDGGFVYLPYSRTDDVKFVNVAVDLNGDGAFASYDAGGKKQEEWLVKDMAAFATGETSVGFPVLMPDRSIGKTLPMDAVVVFTSEKIAADAWPATLPSGATSVSAHVRTYEISDRDLQYVTDGSGQRDTGSAGASEGRAVAVAPPGDTGHATALPGEPYDYNARIEEIPDQNQKYNECSPTGISNNFRWLAKKYGFEDRMPGSTESLINELKGDLQWDNGVTPGQNTIDGKNAFIRRHGLPLEAHLVGEEFDPNIQYKIFQELERGQAVEVGMVFISSEGEWEGAHLVGVAGVLKAGGSRYISLVDPGERARTDGRSYEVYGMDGNEVMGYDTDVTTRIRFAYAQSPVRDAAGTLVFPPGANDFVLDPGDTLAEAGSDITVARGNFGFFNVAVDHPGDHMVGESFTVTAGVTSTGRKTKMRYRDAEGNPQTFEFGAGSPWSLKGHFLGGGNVSPGNVLNKPDRLDVAERRYLAEARFTCVKPGIATVKYVADIHWPRDGARRPEGVWNKYRAQIDSQEQTLVVDSPVFRCLAKPEPAKPSRAAAGQPFCPGVTEDPNGQEIEVLRIGDKCYPKPQFHAANPDNCDARHWHPNMPQVVALDGSKATDPNSRSCGFGKVGEVPEGKVKLSADEAAKFIGGNLER